MAKPFQFLITLHRTLPPAVLRERAAVFPVQRAATFLLVLLLCTHPASPISANEGCSETRPADQARAASAEEQGLKVFIDPDTGELVSEPVAPEGSQSANPPAVVEDQPELPVEVRPDGTLVLDLSDNPPNELRVEVVDGKLIECHHEGSAPSRESEVRPHESTVDRAESERNDER